MYYNTQEVYLGFREIPSGPSGTESKIGFTPWAEKTRAESSSFY
jgi:hypothetical protein